MSEIRSIFWIGKKSFTLKMKSRSIGLWRGIAILLFSAVIDLYQYSPIYDENFKKKFFLNGHMNASGYIFTAKLIDSYIDYIVRQNPGEFETVPLVGTDIKYLPEHYPKLLEESTCLP